METLVFCLLSLGTGKCNILILKSNTLQNALAVIDADDILLSACFKVNC